MNSSQPFADYATVYDLIYQGKDTSSEVQWVVNEMSRWSPELSSASFLELGSGTGRHAEVLTSLGHRVTGVELSEHMISLVPPSAQYVVLPGDARTVRLQKTFDIVVSFFHVVSYQTTDHDLRQIFQTASAHLEGGGLFGFDVWFSPAVHYLIPEPRVLEAENRLLRVKRWAQPEEDLGRSLVTVNYDFEVEHKESGAVDRFSERHVMRHLSANEVSAFAVEAGFEVIAASELGTGRAPSRDTWAIWFSLRKL